MSTQPKRRVYEPLQQMTYDLIKRHPELFVNVPSPQDILFVLDEENEPKSNGRPLLARLSKISDRVIDFIDAAGKLFMLEWFSLNNRSLTLNQSYVLLAQQLLRFERSGEEYKIGPWEVQEMAVILDQFGPNALDERKGDLPSIMDPDFEWSRVGAQRIKLERDRREREAERARAELERKRKQPQQATIHVEPGKPPVLAVDGKEVPPEGEAWQPEEPLVKKDNVIPFPQAAGTDQGA